MSSLRYAASALAVASLAAAQCSVSGTTTVGAEATGLASCPTFTGSIAIATDAPSTVDFGELGGIDGDLIAINATNVQTLTADSVQNITGQFSMNTMNSLFTLNMQGLRGVGQGSRGGIMWQGLPLLQALNFGPGLDSAASINIQNTMIQDLSSVNVKTASQVTIANNLGLTSLKWATTNCTNMTISSNGASTNGANITLDNLQGVSSLSMRNVTALSLPSLENCEGLLDVQSGGLQMLMLPNLTSVGAINISNNTALTNFTIPDLVNCNGGLRVTNNPMLGGDLVFGSLQQIRGDLNINGAFTSLSIPQLNTIQGTSTLASTSDITSTCNTFTSSSKIRGKSTCRSNVNQSNTGGTTTTNGGSDSSQSSGAAISNFIAQPASLFGATGLFAAMLGLM